MVGFDIRRVAAPMGLVLFLASATSGGPQVWGPIPVQPAEYVSPGETCRLHVSSSHRNGEGPARYRMTCRGAVSWEAERPYTLLVAQVSDEGWVGGYAYTFGDPQWLAYDTPGIVEQKVRHTLQLIAFDPQGRDRILDNHDVQIKDDRWFGFIGVEPIVRGVLLHATDDRVIFRLYGADRQEDWAPFRLSDGRAFPHVRPRSDSREPPDKVPESVDDARVVPETPLTVVQFERGNTPWSTSRFALLDATGAVKWTLDDPDPSRHFAPAIVPSSQAGTFDLRLRDGAQRVALRVVPDVTKPGAWMVHESAHRAWKPPALPLPPDPFAALPRLQARPVGTIVLGGETPPPFPHIRGVRAFEIDDRGRFGFIRQDGLAGRVFVLVGPDGALLREVSLPAFAGEADVATAWSGGELWIVVAAAEHENARAVLVDVAAGETRELTLPDERASLMGGRRGRGFAIVGRAAVASIEDLPRILFYDAGGTLHKTVPLASYVRIEGGVELPDGRWLVQGSGDLLLFDPENASFVNLRDTWKSSPFGPTQLAADSEGGILVKDRDGDLLLRRLGTDGSVRATLTPRRTDGRAVDPWWSPQLDSQGRLWVADGDSLLRLDDDGRVEEILGAEAAGPSLGRIVDARVDGSGRIHALDARTAAVHSFDASGLVTGVCGHTRPPGEFPFVVKLLVGASGEVWSPDDVRRTPSHLVSCDGGSRRVWPDKSEPLYPRPDGSFWAKGFMELRLVSEGGSRGIQRSSDGRWLEELAATAMAPDGAVAVESQPHVWPGTPVARTLELYDRYGVPQRTIALPEACPGRLFAYDGAHLFLWAPGEVRVLDVEGHPLQRIAVRASEGHELLPQVAPGEEIWLVDPHTRRVHRFARPPLVRARVAPIASAPRE